MRTTIAAEFAVSNLKFLCLVGLLPGLFAWFASVLLAIDFKGKYRLVCLIIQLAAPPLVAFVFTLFVTAMVLGQ
jgi:Zn-dependent protease with chaperone function